MLQNKETIEWCNEEIIWLPRLLLNSLGSAGENATMRLEKGAAGGNWGFPVGVLLHGNRGKWEKRTLKRDWLDILFDLARCTV